MNLFTNFGDAAVAIIVTGVAILSIFYEPWILLALIVLAFFFSKGVSKIIPVVMALLVFKIEASDWVILSISMWIGLIGNLIWESGGGQILAQVLGLNKPLSAKLRL